MTMERDTLTGIILASVREFAQMSDKAQGHDLAALDEKTRLFGGSGLLDSLGLVSVLMDVEQQVNDSQGTAITIADERAMSQERSPFRSVGSLTDYVLTLLHEQGA
ncbi:MAG: hypothetical protein MUE40_10095 [Anaerolineae bacterium]|jgi:acyl carrier protein|nr:hypothetical protein [Anaerolineae bacterium]